MDILEFQGDSRWLSNFWPCVVWLDGDCYASVEHAYQAAKTLLGLERQKIRLIKQPGQAKRFAKSVTMRPGWESIKVSIMRELLLQKFKKPEFRAKLLATSGTIIEGNYWHDTFWGVCNCPKHHGEGSNTSGSLILEIREELKCQDLKSGN